MEETIEEWREIYGFPLYEVSSHGRVKNRASGRVLVPSKNTTGSLMVGIRKDGMTHMRVLNRLVADAFVEKPIGYGNDDTDVPVHIDHDPTNNRADNLIWRPRWLAVKRTREWKRGPTPTAKVIDTAQMIVYENAFDAAQSVCGLEEQIIRAANSMGDIRVFAREWAWYYD